MDFNAYSSEVLEWLEGVRKNRGTDAEKTLMLCKNIRDYAREQDDEKLLGYAYYYSGETYYLLNDVDTVSQSFLFPAIPGAFQTAWFIGKSL